MKISIVIPTYNKIEELKPCIESVIKHTDLSDMEVIVVSNGCHDGTIEYVNGLGNPFKLIHWDKPLGYTKATNVGISLSDAQYVLLFNNDNVILDWGNWIETLEYPFSQHQTAGITGVHKQWRGKWAWLLFYCVLIKREVFTKVGLLDEIFNPGAGEDTDFCIRAQENGYTVHQVPVDKDEDTPETSFPIWHKGGRTMGDLQNWEAHYDKNELILQQRYGLGRTKKY